MSTHWREANRRPIAGAFDQAAGSSGAYSTRSAYESQWFGAIYGLVAILALALVFVGAIDLLMGS